MGAKSFIKSYKIRKLIKAMNDSKPKPGQSLTLAQIRGQEPNPRAPAPKAPGVGKEGFPVGTIRNGRQKVSSNPSKWVDVSTGRSYDSHEHAVHEHHSVESHDELGSIKKDTMNKLKDMNIFSDDLKIAEGKLTKYLQQKLQAKNMMAAHNVESSRIGGTAKDYQTRYFKMADEAKKAKEDFVQFVKKATERVKKEKK